MGKDGWLHIEQGGEVVVGRYGCWRQMRKRWKSNMILKNGASGGVNDIVFCILFSQ